MAETIASRQERPKSPLCRLVQAFSHILFIGVTVAFLTALTMQAFAQAPPAQTASVRHSLLVTVHDENDVVVSSARLLLSPTGSKTGIAGETDYAGRHEFNGLAAGAYRLEVQKEGFYAITQEGVKVGETSSVEVTLNHLK